MQETNAEILHSTHHQQEKDSTTPEQYTKNIQNGTEVKFYFQRLLNFDYSLMMFSSLNIVLTILYYDADYQESESSQSSLTLYIILALLCAEILGTYLRYRAQVSLEIAQMQLCKYDDIVSSGKWKLMLVEMVVLLFQPYPFLNDCYFQTQDMYDGFTFSFKVNYILVLLGFLRLFIVLRVFLLRTEYMSPRASRNCRMYGCKSDYLFAIKCLFKDTPMALMAVVFFVSIIVFALGLRIAERNLNFQYALHKHMDNPQNLENLENAIWLTIITMTTVGYGDYFPRTIIGRIIDVLLVVWGIFIVSLMVVVLTNALDMDPSQERALIVLNRLEVKNTVKQKAATLMSANFRKYQLVKQINKNPDKAQSMAKQLRQAKTKVTACSKEFQKANKQIRSMYQLDNVYEEMTRQFEFINDQIGFLTDNQRETIHCLRSFLEQRKKERKEKEHEQLLRQNSKHH